MTVCMFRVYARVGFETRYSYENFILRTDAVARYRELAAKGLPSMLTETYELVLEQANLPELEAAALAAPDTSR